MKSDKIFFFRNARFLWRISWSFATLCFFDSFVYFYCVIVGVLSIAFKKVVLYSISEKEFSVLSGIYGFQQKISFPLNQINYVKITSRERLYCAGYASRYFIPQKILLIRLKDKLSIGKLKQIIKLRNSFFTSVFRIHTIDVNNEGNEIYLTKKPRGGFESILYAIQQKVTPDEPISLKNATYKKILASAYDLILIFSIVLVSYFIYTGKIRQGDYYFSLLKLKCYLEGIKNMYF